MSADRAEIHSDLGAARVAVAVVNPVPANTSNLHPGSFVESVGEYGEIIMGTKPTATGALERFTLAAAEIGIDVTPVRYPQGTRTAKDAAAAIGCDISQIVKSLVLSAGGECLLALTAGHNRVDLDALSDIVGRGVEMANAEEARSATGYAIGGTPPFGHVNGLPTYIDPALMTHSVVYAAAGRPDTCFAVTPDALADASKAALADFVAH